MFCWMLDFVGSIFNLSHLFHMSLNVTLKLHHKRQALTSPHHMTQLKEEFIGIVLGCPIYLSNYSRIILNALPLISKLYVGMEHDS